MASVLHNHQNTSPYVTMGDQASVLSEIFHSETQIVIWHQQMSDLAIRYAESFQQLHRHFSIREILAPEALGDYLKLQLRDGEGKEDLVEAIETLAEMFCYLFELRALGFRMQLLDRAMCPRFHRDQVPCRLVMTLRGPATHWLSPEQIRDKDPVDAFNQLDTGDIALLKGAGWYGNQDKGVMHRSPAVPLNDWRLFLSMDFAN